MSSPRSGWTAWGAALAYGRVEAAIVEPVSAEEFASGAAIPFGRPLFCLDQLGAVYRPSAASLGWPSASSRSFDHEIARDRERVALSMGSRLARETGASRGPRAPAGAPGRASFEEVYAENFAFVFRTMRRMGVPPAQVDDAVQEVFVVVHRRLGEFEGAPR